MNSQENKRISVSFWEKLAKFISQRYSLWATGKPVLPGLVRGMMWTLLRASCAKQAKEMSQESCLEFQGSRIFLQDGHQDHQAAPDVMKKKPQIQSLWVQKGASLSTEIPRQTLTVTQGHSFLTPRAE